MDYKSFFKTIWRQKSLGIFIFMAVVLWYLNKLSEDYSAYIEIPIRIVSDPSSDKWVENPDFTVTAHCQTEGRTIMAYRSGAASTLYIPLDHLSAEKIDEYSYVIDNYSLGNYIKSQRMDLKINHIDDVTRTIRISKPSEKKVPVISDITATYAPEHMNTAGNIILGFDSVILEAPAIILDTIENIRTETIVHRNLSGSIEANARLVIPENVKCSNRKVPYEIPVDRYTQYKIKTKVLKSAPSFIGKHSGGRGLHWSNYNGKLVIIPDEVTIFINLPMGARTKEKDIVAFIDFNKHNDNPKYEVQLSGVPNGSEIVAIEPRMVNVFKDIK